MPLRIFISIMSCLFRNTIIPEDERKRLCQTPLNNSSASFKRFCVGSSRRVWSKSLHDIRKRTACMPSKTCSHLFRWSRCPPYMSHKISYRFLTSYFNWFTYHIKHSKFLISSTHSFWYFHRKGYLMYSSCHFSTV